MENVYGNVEKEGGADVDKRKDATALEESSPKIPKKDIQPQ